MSQERAMGQVPVWRRKMMWARHRKAGRLKRARRLGDERLDLKDRRVDRAQLDTLLDIVGERLLNFGGEGDA